MGARLQDDGGDNRGAVHIVFLTRTGSMKGEEIISDTQGGLGTMLSDGDVFGGSMSSLGDFNDE